MLEELERRVAELERTVERQGQALRFLGNHVGRDISTLVPDGGGARVSAEEEMLVHQGRLIEAIKSYRERTRAGLAEAKAAIDAVARSGR